jgi:hypothetical protein
MKEFWIIWIIFCMIFVLLKVGSYLVKDYRKGIVYKGFIGKLQNLIKH